jgi:hypothetical protein
MDSFTLNALTVSSSTLTGDDPWRDGVDAARGSSYVNWYDPSVGSAPLTAHVSCDWGSTMFYAHGGLDREGHVAPEDDRRLDGLPTSVKRLATLLDRPAPYRPYQRAITDSTYELKTSAISTLIRVIDAADDDARTAYSVLNAQHRRLTAYGWYAEWSADALPAALFGGLTRNGLLDLLRESRRRRRRERIRRPRLVALVALLRNQLDRLANFIAPNAPPLGVHCIDVVAGVAAR